MKGYSGGMRRRLDLAAGLVTRPPVLFLDEPTTGLDPTSRLRMWEVIRELVAEGVTLLLTTQYLEEADELADRIVVIDHGTVIAEGTSAELKAADRRGPPDRHPDGAASRRPGPPSSPTSTGPSTSARTDRRLQAAVRSASGLATTRRPGSGRRRRGCRRRRGPAAVAGRRLLLPTGHAATDGDSARRTRAARGGGAGMTRRRPSPCEPRSGLGRNAAGWRPGCTTWSCSPGATWCTSPASRCSSRT